MYRSVFLGLSLGIMGCVGGETPDVAEEVILELTSPEAAAWLNDGSVNVTGVAQGLTNLQVNGETVSVQDGTFQSTLHMERGINVLEVSGSDARGDTHFVRHAVIAGDFATAGSQMEDAVHLRVNKAGLEKAGTLIDAYLSPDDMIDMAMEMNPVYEDSYSVWGWEAVTVQADLDWVYFETPELNLVPRDGYLWVEAVIPTVYVDVGVSGEVAGMDYDEPVWVSADSIVVTGEAVLNAENGRLQADLNDPQMTMHGFFIDTDLLPGGIEDGLLGDTIQAQLETMVVAQVNESLPQMLEETLQDLDLTYQMDLMGTEVTVSAEFGEVGVDSQGVAAKLDLQMGIPSQGDHYYRGYLTSGQDMDPRPDYSSALFGSISDDLMNRLMFETWRGGMLKMSLSTEDESLPAAALHHFHASQGTVSVNAGLPPVLIERDQQLTLQLGELDVLVETPGGELGEHLQASVAGSADVELKVVDGLMTMDLGNFDVTITVRDSDWGASDEAITRMLEDNLPIASLLTLVKDFEYPVPTVAGLSIQSVSLERDPSTVYTNMKVSLD